MENLLLEPAYSEGWYRRELERFALRSSTKSARPSDVLLEVIDYLKHDVEPDETSVADPVLRFGQPKQVIIRSEDEEAEQRVRRLLNKLPRSQDGTDNPIVRWFQTLAKPAERPFLLPSGVIHFADPSSSEMLILFVTANAFDTEAQLIGANLLIDYIGASQGSEMFRIIRQEMRASYDPASEFIVLDKNKAVFSMSATVEASNWPAIHQRISRIYSDVLAGKIDENGLNLQYDTLRRNYYFDFFNDPLWGAQHYLYAYPDGTSGRFGFPIVEALDNAPLGQIRTQPDTYLPPLDGFLVVLVGGGPAPHNDLTSTGYCALPKNSFLRHCLDALMQAQE